MQIFVQTLSGKHIVLAVEQTRFVNEIKKEIENREQIPTNLQRLIFSGIQLDDEHTLNDYSINQDSTLTLTLRLRGGIINANTPSEALGPVENDHSTTTTPLAEGNLTQRFIRNTHGAGVYEVENGTSYADPASSAYINAILQKRETRPPPSYRECYSIACYNGTKGGDVSKSIQHLENHFKYGIHCEPKKTVDISEILTQNVVLAFTTSHEGWKKVIKGDLTEFPGSDKTYYHAVLVDGYDFEHDCMICKNSFKAVKAAPRFNFKPSAAHDCYYYVVSSDEKGEVKEDVVTFEGQLFDTNITCAFLDHDDAMYCNNYVCELQPEKEGNLKYIGYDINQWISLNLKNH